MKLLKLETNSCPKCKELGERLDRMGVSYEVVNLDENPELGAKYPTMTVPILTIIDDEGNEIIPASERARSMEHEKIAALIERTQ